MGNRHRDKGRQPSFVAMYRHTMKSAAWKAMSVGARAVNILLTVNYNTRMQNSVYLSARTGSELLGGVRPNNVSRWLDENEHYGFIVKVRDAHLAGVGEGKAAHYRLTDRSYAGQSPTHDFEKWDGVLFAPKPRRTSEAEMARLNELKQSRKIHRTITRPVTPRNTAVHIRVNAAMTKNGNKRNTAVHITDESERNTACYITSLTRPGGEEGENAQDWSHQSGVPEANVRNWSK